MYIYATINKDTKRILDYEIVEAVQSELSSETKKFIEINDNIGIDFYEGFDAYSVIIPATGIVCSLSTSYEPTTMTNKRSLPLFANALLGPLNISQSMANAILALPWYIERTNVINSFENL